MAGPHGTSARRQRVGGLIADADNALAVAGYLRSL
jgi:hypothetical protein